MILAAILALAGFVILGYFDVHSTKTFIKRGTGHEANPVVRWLMWKFPSGWPYVKIGGMAAVGVAALVIVPLRYALLMLLGMDGFYLFIVLRNYRAGR